ncbi:hypothetical protein [Aestuariivirga sp.]|uniref:hypothetical protein n=1 Tax=Aestuariivirga sp. TaxID=2650926 RepID=UPI0039E32E19
MRLPLHNVIPLTKIIFQTVVKYPVPLLKAFAWPALIFVVFPWAVLPLMSSFPELGIFLFPGLLMGFLASVTLVGIVRYLDLDKDPPLDPRRIALRAVGHVSLILVPLYITLYLYMTFDTAFQLAVFATGGALNTKYYDVLLTDITQFAFASIAMGVLYPLTGPIALLERVEIKSAWRMVRDSLPALLMLAALLLLIVICGNMAYNYLVSGIKHGLLSAMISMPRAALIFSFLAYLLNLPLLFFTLILPAIAVAHLTEGLGRRILGSVMVLASAPESQK